MILGDKGLFGKRLSFTFFLFVYLNSVFKCGHAKKAAKVPIFKHIVANIRDFFWLG